MLETISEMTKSDAIPFYDYYSKYMSDVQDSDIDLELHRLQTVNNLTTNSMIQLVNRMVFGGGEIDPCI
ncbi:hypothetical protein RUMCAL_00373 [Ruminococcus callidus ATCC 27760]|jgi:hypothetical protein|uniref:Uncharacterized protein n=1 Tax=Ruminococcus callidus ATCC 27760 TaxID=411473 RepID=U2KFJ1_9FIRM|nr:hypothetical protein [Ruminococcus callidus]ERJ97301.1 hypothetical protein RUMCAL_00373 [Ruminococcus callidus ATCC 27760]